MGAKLYVSRGNIKMPTIPTFNLPSRSTCPGCTAQCAAKCYARKAERYRPTVLPCRRRNWRLSKGAEFVASMVAIIRRRGRPFFRIHESGDFYSQDYLESWFEIARALPEVRFLAFTKSFSLNFANKPENLEIVWSIWPDSELGAVPAGRRAWAGQCPAMPSDAIECPGFCDSCGLCWSLSKVGKDVHFNIH